MTSRKRTPDGKPRTAATGAERQRLYRERKALRSIDVSPAVRQKLKSLRGRLDLSSDAVLARALDLLAADLDRRTSKHRTQNVPQASENVSSPPSRRRRQPVAPGGGFASQRDAKPPLAGLDPNAPPPKPASARRAEAAGKQRELFDDLEPKPASKPSARKR